MAYSFLQGTDSAKASPMLKNKKPPVTKVFQIEIGLVDGSFEACFLTGNRSVSAVRMFGFLTGYLTVQRWAVVKTLTIV